MVTAIAVPLAIASEWLVERDATEAVTPVVAAIVPDDADPTDITDELKIYPSF